MKTLLIFSDTETTGFTKFDQILDYALVFTHKQNLLEELNQEILVKDNVIPNPNALLINNINPFSKEWKLKAISENEAVHKIIKEINLNKEKIDSDNSKVRVVFVAYNAQFDDTKFTEMFSRNGKNFKALIPLVFDPLEMCRELVKQKIVKTAEREMYGKVFNSSALMDVYQGMGFSIDKSTAHNALVDTKALVSVANKAYLLTYGKELSEAEASPENYTAGEVQTILYLTEKMGLVKKTVLIIKNDQENKKILAIDSELLKESPKKAVIELDHYRIFDEILLESQLSSGLKAYYKSNQLALDSMTTSKKEDLAIDISDSSEIASVMNKKEKDLPLSSLEEGLLDQAEDLSYSLKNTGWSFKEKGEDYREKNLKIYSSENFNIYINNVRISYVLEVNTNRDSRKDSENIESSRKTDILKSILESKLLPEKNEEYKIIDKLLTANKPEKYVDKKFETIISEFNTKKAEVFNGANKLHKEILTDLLAFYKKNWPEKFKDINLPVYKLNLGSFKKPN